MAGRRGTRQSKERLRLAREVHDVAGHGLAVIAMQAGVTLRVLDHDPEGARAALRGIRATSRDALAELRSEVEAMQYGTAAPRRPGTGLADLPALVERMRETGLPVTLELPEAGAAEVPVEVNRAAYRIVQEALTNVLRHAGPQASAQVTVAVADGRLMLEVRGNGRGGVATPGGGVDGMRDRAAAVGGVLSAGPAPEGGFLVKASLALSGLDGDR